MGMSEQVHDAFGDPWDVEETRPTPHGWPLHLGRPVLAGGGHPRQGRAVVPTAQVRDHLAATIESPYDVDLPIARATVTALRKLLGLGWRDSRRGWWDERAGDLADLAGAEFAARHGVSEASASLAHKALFGRKTRHAGWWREKEAAALLGSDLPRAYVAHRLRISTGAVGRLRWQLQQERPEAPASPDPRTPEGYRAGRERAGWTQAQYAELVERDRMTICGRETMRQELPLEAALALLYLIEHEGRTPWDTHTNGDA